MVRSLRRRQRGCAIFDHADAIVCSAHPIFCVLDAGGCGRGWDFLGHHSLPVPTRMGSRSSFRKICRRGGPRSGMCFPCWPHFMARAEIAQRAIQILRQAPAPWTARSRPSAAPWWRARVPRRACCACRRACWPFRRACCLVRRICSPFPRACPAFPSVGAPSSGRGRGHPSDAGFRRPFFHASKRACHRPSISQFGPKSSVAPRHW